VVGLRVGAVSIRRALGFHQSTCVKPNHQGNRYVAPISLPTSARMNEPPLSRRAMIAEAVITIIGTKGVRSVTHRSVDEYLGLPPGSSSYYFRKRNELLEAGFHRMIETNLAALAAGHARFLEAHPDGRLLDIESVARYEYENLKRSLLPERRPRVLARFEFFIHASRDPRLSAVQDSALRKLFELDVLIFKRLGAKNPWRAAAEFGDLRRGRITTYILIPSAIWGRDISVHCLEQEIARIIVHTDEEECDLDLDSRSLP